MMIGVVTACTVISYALYTVSEETVRKFHTRALLLTLPFVLYGIFRYLYLVYHRSEGGDPTQTLLRGPAHLDQPRAVGGGGDLHHLLLLALGDARETSEVVSGVRDPRGVAGDLRRRPVRRPRVSRPLLGAGLLGGRVPGVLGHHPGPRPRRAAGRRCWSAWRCAPCFRRRPAAQYVAWLYTLFVPLVVLAYLAAWATYRLGRPVLKPSNLAAYAGALVVAALLGLIIRRLSAALATRGAAERRRRSLRGSEAGRRAGRAGAAVSAGPALLPRARPRRPRARCAPRGGRVGQQDRPERASSS